MRLPIPFLLYVTALGLFGWAAWTVYDMLPLWKLETRNASSAKGQSEAVKLVARGKGSGPISADWRYSNDVWWPQLKQVNLIGKLPPPPVDPIEAAKAKEMEKPPIDMTPLEDIFELVSLVYDPADGGKGPKTHVFIRYKQGANVEPPEWWERENAPPSPAAFGGPGDAVASRVQRPTRGSVRGSARGNAPAPAPAMPTGGNTLTGREIIQELSLEESPDGRRGPSLWPTYSHIRLVRVAPDAQTAFFVRETPPPDDGAPAPEAKEEPLLKTTVGLSQDLLRVLRKSGGEADGNQPANTDGPANPNNSLAWRDEQETTRRGNSFNIGRKDEQRFRENANDFLNHVYVDTYTGSKMSGLMVRGVDPQIAQRFGVAAGEVLLEINNRKVGNKAQAVNQVRRDYDRGVRTFATKWLANGTIIERTYQAPDK